MRCEPSVMHALLKHIPWDRFETLVADHKADHRVRKLSTKSQLVAMLHAQVSGSSSLREIETTMASDATRLYHLGAKAPKRSTLADANATRPAAVFTDLFATLLKQVPGGLRKTAKDAIRLIDATSLPLNSLSQNWAAYKAHRPGAKLHIVYDPNAAAPVHFQVTAARTNEITMAKAMDLKPGITYVFDLVWRFRCSPVFQAKQRANI